MTRLAVSGLAVGLVFALGLACAAAALMGMGGRFSARMDLATHFAPFWLTGALVVVLYALTLAPRDLKLALLGLGLVGVVAAGSLIAPEFLRPMSPKAAADAPHQLKIIQFNAWRENAEIEPTAQWLASQDADVVVMEEAPPALVDRVAQLSGLRLNCRNCGVAILTRVAVLKPPPRPKGEKPVRRPDWHVRPPIARVRFIWAGREVSVLGVHTVWPTQAGWQRAQGQYLAARLDPKAKARMILVGDFNSTPWSFGRRREDALFGLERRTRALFTWPARLVLDGQVTLPFPFLPIDHVYAGSDWRTVSIKRGPRLGSDHYPVVAVLALKPD